MKTLRKILIIFISLGLIVAVIGLYVGAIMVLWNLLADFFSIKKIDFIHATLLASLVKVITYKVMPTTASVKEVVKAQSVHQNTHSPKNYN